MSNYRNGIMSIKNAYMAGKRTILLKSSKLLLNVLKVLKKEGYIKDFAEILPKISDVSFNQIEVFLRYVNNKPALKNIKLISTPSNKIYGRIPGQGVPNKKIIQRPKETFGIIILSTNKGILPYYEAAAMNVGGEVLMEVI